MSKFKFFGQLANYMLKNSESKPTLCCRSLLKPVNSDLFNFVPILSFHSTPRMNADIRGDRRRAKKTALNKDLGVAGAFSQMIDTTLLSDERFPTYDLPDRLFNGVPFKDIPVVSIKSSKNNTILSLGEKGGVIIIRSCGMEGFKNCRKGTNLAAQTTGVSFGLRAIKRGFKDVRVVLNGLGPGRLSAMKGLQLSGMNIISITDKTRDSTRDRPKKERRV